MGRHNRWIRGGVAVLVTRSRWQRPPAARSHPMRAQARVRPVAARSRSWWPRTSGAASPRSSAVDHVNVTSIITSPDTDPHDYEPTAAGRTGTRRRPVRDLQRPRLRHLGRPGASTPTRRPGRKVLEIGDLLGLHEGDNPHRWYFPDDVDKVIDQITADYKTIDPADAAYFDQQRQTYETTGARRLQGHPHPDQQNYAGHPSVPARASSSASPKQPASTC